MEHVDRHVPNLSRVLSRGRPDAFRTVTVRRGFERAVRPSGS
jgi:hypothetical protein